MLRRGLLATSLLFGMPTLALAQATEQGAADIRTQIRQSIVDLLGPSAKVPADLPIQVTPEGDHYKLVLPLGDKPDAPTLSADAQQTSGGPWALSKVMLSSPATFTVKLPKPEPGKPDTGMSGTIQYTATFGQQDGSALFDPSYKTPSTSTSAFKDLEVVADGLNLHQVTHVASATSNTSLTPGADGKLDVVGTSSFDGYRIDTDQKGANPVPPFSISMGHVTTDIHLMDVSREAVVQTIHMAAAAGAETRATGAKSGLPPDAFATMAAVASGMTMNQAGNDVSFDVKGVQGGLERIKVSLALTSKDGLAQGDVDMGMDGFKLSDIGLGPLAQFIPTAFELHPTFSGVPTGPLIQLFQASSNGGQPTPEQIEAVFGQGGVTVGLQSVSLDAAGSKLEGNGKLVFAAADAFEGSGLVSITNFDALQQKLAADPSTAQAGPALIFLKGIGKTVGDKMVWDITYKGQSLLVNGTDLSAMMGGAGGAGAKPQARPEPKTPVPPPAGQPQLRRRN